MSVSAATRQSLQVNYQGSVDSLADASGNLVGINSYDEYGKPATGNTGTFQYTGQAWLPQAGVYYYKARMYDPRLGRFLQTDPIGYKDDLDLYAYVGNDPLDRSDPSGLRCQGDATNGTCTVDYVQETRGGGFLPLTASKRKEYSDAGKGFVGGLKKTLGIGKAGLGAKIDSLESSMSQAYRAASKDGARQVVIAGNASGSIAATTVTGTQVATALQRTDLNVANYADSVGGNVLAATSPDRTRITFYDGALSELPHGQEITTLHEGFHAAVHTGWDSEPQPLHRAPFNEAAEQLLEQGQ